MRALRWFVSDAEVRGPGKPKPSDKVKKIFSLKAATMAWSGAAANGLKEVDGRGSGLAVTSSMTSLAAMGTKGK